MNAKNVCGINANRPSNRKSESKKYYLLEDLISNGLPNIPDRQKENIFMKTYGNLFYKLCSMENLTLAFKKARKGKTKQWYVKEFEEKLDKNLSQLKHELESQVYRPRKLKRFIIRDPKTRVIHASNFRDRVVHHAICNILEPIYDKIFIYDSYASRKNKGSIVAIDRFDAFQRKVSNNGRLVKDAKDDNMILGYVLKADIKKYFDSVDHDILISIIKKKIRDEKVVDLIRTILETNANCLTGGGREACQLEISRASSSQMYTLTN